jgi:hypothetical protein
MSNERNCEPHGRRSGDVGREMDTERRSGLDLHEDKTAAGLGLGRSPEVGLEGREMDRRLAVRTMGRITVRVNLVCSSVSYVCVEIELRVRDLRTLHPPLPSSTIEDMLLPLDSDALLIVVLVERTDSVRGRDSSVRLEMIESFRGRSFSFNGLEAFVLRGESSGAAFAGIRETFP